VIVSEKNSTASTNLDLRSPECFPTICNLTCQHRLYFKLSHRYDFGKYLAFPPDTKRDYTRFYFLKLNLKFRHILQQSRCTAFFLHFQTRF